MNKRIKELATASGALQYNQWVDPVPARTVKNAKELQLFAEMIVKECVESIKVWRDAADEHMNEEEYYKGYRSGCDDSIVEIQTRFGVE